MMARNRRQHLPVDQTPFGKLLVDVSHILVTGILRLKLKEANRQSEALNVSEKGLDVLAELSVNGDGPARVTGRVDNREATKT